MENARNSPFQTHMMPLSYPKTLLTIISLSLLFVSGCISGNSTIYSIVRDAELKAGAAIPAPSDDVILTVTGLVGAENVAGKIEMDLATIESMQVVEYTVTDPFVEKPITYRGVLMSDLFDLWQVDPQATTLEVVALNDYQVSVPLKEMYDYPVFFAFMADGQYMEVSYRGPAMLVYPYDDRRFDPAVYDNFWVWQIKSIDVR